MSVVPELEEHLREKRFREAISLVRRTSRAELDHCRRFISELSSGQWSWSQLAQHHPRVVAALAGDPDPVLLDRLAGRREDLVRALRRGRTLEALKLVRDVGEASAVEAKTFLDALVSRGLAWEEVQARYTGKPSDFWAVEPKGPGLPERPSSDGLWVPPERFSSTQYDELVKTGQNNRAVSLIRRFARCPLDEARRFVDASDFQDWASLARSFPTVVAALAGHPDPALLEKLSPVKDEYLGALRAERKLAANRLAQEHGGATLSQASAFLKALVKHNLAWDEIQKLYADGAFKWVKKKVQVPVPAAAAPAAVKTAPRPAVKPPAPPPPPKAPEPVPEPPPPPVDPRVLALQALGQTHPEIAALLPEGQVPEDLASLSPLLKEIASLAAAKDPQALQAASQALLILEERGLTRDALIKRFPALEWAIPPGPLSRNASRLAAALPLLQAGKVVEAAAEAIPDELEPLLAELQRTLPSGDPRRILPKLEPLLQKMDTDELFRRVPAVKGWIPPSTEPVQKVLEEGVDGVKDLFSAAGRAELERRFPKLAARLNDHKMDQLKRLQPELLKLLKRGRVQKALTLLQEQIGFGMGDTKALLEMLEIL